MLKEEKKVSVKKIEMICNKIANGIEKFQLYELDKELLKIYPTDNSEVFLATDYDEDDNSVGISIYVSNPQTEEEVKPISFNKLLFEYLILTDIQKLTNVWECLELMERKSGDKYDLDFIPVFYTEEINMYDLNLRITKK